MGSIPSVQVYKTAKNFLQSFLVHIKMCQAETQANEGWLKIKLDSEGWWVYFRAFSGFPKLGGTSQTFCYVKYILSSMGQRGGERSTECSKI